MSYDSLKHFVAKNGKEYTVCTKVVEKRSTEDLCYCCGLEWPHKKCEVRVEIVEMYDEDGVDVPRTPQSRIFREAQCWYMADGKWHIKGCEVT
ncbi:MAG: hypothetical protein MUF19_01440 [Candidatus Pacebacteria bacterium]|jgi:hypothetical protein|nr:hypothetical protein [Candidatus Paceibacterota bacterium]